jgi:sialate O-acetylesterase
MTKTNLFIILFFLGLLIPGYSKVYVSSLFGDHMVLQRNSFPALWGRADPGEMINVSGSWDEMSLVTYADSKGRWRINLATPEAGGPYKVKIESSNVIEINDVMIGEVWLASGQSNMAWRLAQTEKAAAEIPNANFNQIRFFKVPQEVSSTPRLDAKGDWQVCESKTAANFSGVAYYFAKELHQELGVPIGIIQSTWGGTPSEAWTSRRALEAHPSFQNLLDRFDDQLRAHRNDPNSPDPIHHQNPTTLYNAMISPLIPYDIQGVIWYQGEFNRYDPWLYRNLFPALIYNWRHDWNKLLSFYYVQIAPYDYGPNPSGAGVREAQLMSMNIPSTGMAVTMDIGNPEDIHPTNKRDVGKRLALWALAKDYQKEVVYSGPLYKKMEVEEDKIRLFFDYVGGGLMAKGGELTHFEIAGEDQIFVPATAIIENNTVVVSSDAVSDPQAVRYGFNNTDMPNLFNQEGLPASSFRTDDWPVFFIKPKIKPTYQRSRDEFLVQFEYSEVSGHELFYTLDGTEPDRNSNLYQKPFIVTSSATIKTKAFSKEIGSPDLVTRKVEKHKGMNGRIQTISTLLTQYNAGGKMALIDGIFGLNDPHTYWLGFADETLEIIIDLGNKQDISSISTNFLRRHTTRMFLPKNLTYSVSNNGKKYKDVAEFSINQPKDYLTNEIKTFSQSFSESARYVKITAESIGTAPEWHNGNGKKVLMMIDEVVIK